ncbi:MAG: MFS transporter [Candidatus Anaerobiospirillum merdipullorum]|uniref:MFS transporter n=1 Tax=Candidatus Anaerobiospirillum merdipullorum TaxID=2838450 RepID=A0A9E2NSF6_9GAMM|nr:MFS transporter [Candidatus Anaerobiospirillum merdipullorum]
MRTQAWDDLHLILQRNFILVTGVNFLVMLADYQYFVTTAYFAIKLFNASISSAGAAAGMFVIGCLVARFFMGNFIGMIGLKRSLCLSVLACAVVAMLGYFADSLWLYILQRFIFGICIGALGTTTATIVAYSVPAHLQGLGVSIFSLSTALGLALGPFIGITVQQWWGYGVLNAETTALCGIGFIAALFTSEPQGFTPKRQSLLKLTNYIDPPAIKVSLGAMLVPLGYSCVTAYLTSMCQERGIPQAAAWFFLCAAIMTILTRPFAGRMFDVIGESVVIYPAIVLSALAMFILAYASSTPMVILAGLVQGMGFGNYQSSGQALILKVAVRERFAQATSTFFICWDLSLGVAPYLFGFVATHYGFATMLLIISIFILVSLPLYYFTYGRYHPLKRSLRRKRAPGAPRN